MAQTLSDLVAQKKPSGIAPTLRDFGRGYNREAVAGLLGAPVDMATTLANLLTAGGGYLGHKAGLLDQPPDLIQNNRAVGSSDWIYDRLPHQPVLSNSPAEQAGRLAGALMSPPAVLKAAPTTIRALSGALQEKSPGVINRYMEDIGGKLNVSPAAGHDGVMNSTPKRTASDLSKIKGYSSADETISNIEKLAEQHGTVFIRWSGDEASDFLKGAKSRDAISGEFHNGLSAIPIYADTHPVDIAKRLSEYSFLRLKDRASRPRVYIGNVVGTDSDGYALIKPTSSVMNVPDDVLNAIDSGYSKAFELRNNIEESSRRIEKLQGAAKEIERKSLDAAILELESIINKNIK